MSIKNCVDIENKIVPIMNFVEAINDRLYKAKDPSAIRDSVSDDLTKVWKNLDDLKYEVVFDSDMVSLDTENIEDWKDLVIQALPENASVAMANDVEAALDQFKSVY